MWISRYGAHSHSDALSSSFVKRSIGESKQDNYRHGDIIVRVEGGVILPLPRVVIASEAKTPEKSKSPL